MATTCCGYASGSFVAQLRSDGLKLKESLPKHKQDKKATIYQTKLATSTGSRSQRTSFKSDDHLADKTPVTTTSSEAKKIEGKKGNNHWHISEICEN